MTLLEDGAFHLEDGVTVSDGTYSWDTFEKEVIEEKYRILADFLDTSEDHGMSFMYHLLELIRKKDEKIHFARLVYYLSRMEPDKEGSQKENYQYFSQKIYKWLRSAQAEKECRQLKTAMNIYAYKNRKKEAGEDEN